MAIQVTAEDSFFLRFDRDAYNADEGSFCKSKIITISNVDLKLIIKPYQSFDT